MSLAAIFFIKKSSIPSPDPEPEVSKEPTNLVGGWINISETSDSDQTANCQLTFTGGSSSYTAKAALGIYPETGEPLYDGPTLYAQGSNNSWTITSQLFADTNLTNSSKTVYFQITDADGTVYEKSVTP